MDKATCTIWDGCNKLKHCDSWDIYVIHNVFIQCVYIYIYDVWTLNMMSATAGVLFIKRTTTGPAAF